MQAGDAACLSMSTREASLHAEVAELPGVSRHLTVRCGAAPTNAPPRKWTTPSARLSFGAIT